MPEATSIQLHHLRQAEMLAYFPTPYEDELLYSMIARYGVHTGQTNNQKAIVKDVFNTTSAAAIPDLPSHIDEFCNQTKQIWKIRPIEIAKQYTLAPLYLPFLEQAQAKLVLASMLSRYGGNIHTRCGIAASSIQSNKTFRFCPLCKKQQFESIGESYWQRQHQLPGIDVCLLHNCQLKLSNIPFHPKQKHMYKSLEFIESRDHCSIVTLCKIERLLIENLNELLNQARLSGFTFHQWSKFYYQLANDWKMNRGNRIDHDLIREKMFLDWQNTRFAAYLPSNIENSWLVNIFRKQRKSFHPIRHIMVWCSLLPFDNLTSIFERIGVMPKVEEGYIRAEKGKQAATEKNKKTQRESWILLINSNVSLGVKQLRQTSTGGRLYAWLYRHDYNWLMKHTPTRKTANVKRNRVEYIKWDENNIKLLNEVLNDFSKLSKRPQLTTTFFIKKLPRASSVEKHLNELPKTNLWLSKNAESKIEYRKFRILIAAENLISEGFSISQWRILRRANIRKEYVSKEVEHLITSLIQKQSMVA